MHILIAGSTSSGKTLYLAALLLAQSAYPAGLPLHVRPGRGNAASQTLAQQGSSLLLGRLPEANVHVNRFELAAELPGSSLFGLGREELRLTLIDPPGGDCLPSAGSPIHPAVLDACVEADALMLLLAADRSKRPADMDFRLDRFTREVLALRRARNRPEQFERLAVVLTQSDTLFHGPQARRRLAALDPRQTLSSRAGQGFLSMARRLTSWGGVECFLVSALGFDTRDESPAAIREGANWRLPGGNGSVFAHWKPFGIFAPLEYVSRGFFRQRLRSQ